MVRGAKLEDARPIAELHVRAWRAAYRGFLPADLLDGISVSLRESAWRDILGGEAAAGPTLVSQEDGGIVGFCSLALPSRDDDAGERVAEVSAIYVEPPRWMSGVGRELLEAGLGRMAAEDWDQLTLWTFKRNAQARAFFARFGLRLDGRERYHESGQAVVRLRTALPGANPGT